MRRVSWRVIGFLIGAGLPACAGESAGPSNPAGKSGSLRVTATTSGTDLDLDGYVVSLDRKSSEEIGINGSITLPGLPAGPHMVWLDGIAPNCWDAGSNPVGVTIPVSGSTLADFGITCTTPNSIILSMVTRGTNLPDTVVVGVSGTKVVCSTVIDLCLPIMVLLYTVGLPTNGTIQLTGATGNVGLTLTAPQNCVVAEGISRRVTVAAGGVARISFAATCS